MVHNRHVLAYVSILFGLLHGCAGPVEQQAVPYVKPASIATVELTGNEVLDEPQNTAIEEASPNGLGRVLQSCSAWFTANPRKIGPDTVLADDSAVCHRGRFAMLFQQLDAEGNWKRESVSGTYRWAFGQQDELPIAELELRAGLAGVLGVVRQEGSLFTLTLSNGDAIQAFSWQELMQVLLNELLGNDAQKTVQAGVHELPVTMPANALLAWLNHLDKEALPEPWQWQDIGQRVRMYMTGDKQKIRFDFMPLQLGYPAVARNAM